MRNPEAIQSSFPPSSRAITGRPRAAAAGWISTCRVLFLIRPDRRERWGPCKYLPNNKHTLFHIPGFHAIWRKGFFMQTWGVEGARARRHRMLSSPWQEKRRLATWPLRNEIFQVLTLFHNRFLSYCPTTTTTLWLLLGWEMMTPPRHKELDLQTKLPYRLSQEGIRRSKRIEHNAYQRASWVNPLMEGILGKITKAFDRRRLKGTSITAGRRNAFKVQEVNFGGGLITCRNLLVMSTLTPFLWQLLDLSMVLRA